MTSACLAANGKGSLVFMWMNSEVYRLDSDHIQLNVSKLKARHFTHSADG